MSALEIAQRYFDAWNRRDASGVAALFTPDGTYSDPASGGELSGSAIAAYVQGLASAFPDFSFEIASAAEAGPDSVAAQWIMRGANTGPFAGLPPTGRRIELAGADFIAVEGDRIRSVRGYFDSAELPRQLGLQVLVQPESIGPFSFGKSVRVRSGKRSKPGAFSITAIEVRSEDEVKKVADYSQKIAPEMLAMPGFIGWLGVTVGRTMMTVTAWTDPGAPRELLKGSAHSAAMREFFGNGIASGGFTSVWVPDRINTQWVRCGACGHMDDYEKSSGRCRCGEALAQPPPYW